MSFEISGNETKEDNENKTLRSIWTWPLFLDKHRPASFVLYQTITA
jgi:hypothetical protein